MAKLKTNIVATTSRPADTRTIRERSADPQAEACGLGVKHHASSILGVSVQFAGIGALCPDVFIAFLVAAKVVQTLGSHFDPSDYDQDTINTLAGEIIAEYFPGDGPKNVM